MFEKQLQFEREQLMQKEQEDLRDKQIEMMKLDAQRDAQNTRAAIDLQDLEARTQTDAEKNFVDLVKTVQETTKE